MKKYERWQVHGYLRPVIDFTQDGEAFDTGLREQVVVILDPTGRQWHVTVEQGEDGKPRLTSILLQGTVIDQTELRSVPLGYLAEAAWGHVTQVEAARDKGAPLDEAMAEAAAQPGQVEVNDPHPSKVQEIAAAWHATPSSVIVDGERIGRRKALATQFHLSVFSIDKYVREARDLGLIAPATTGRRRDNTPTDETARRSTKMKKEQNP